MTLIRFSPSLLIRVSSGPKLRLKMPWALNGKRRKICISSNWSRNPSPECSSTWELQILSELHSCNGKTKTAWSILKQFRFGTPKIKTMNSKINTFKSANWIFSWRKNWKNKSRRIWTMNKAKSQTAFLLHSKDARTAADYNTTKSMISPK